MPRASQRKTSNVEKKVRRLMGRAIQRYGLINADDRILVSLSGGVDSTSLLWLLHDRLGRIPITYKLFAAHVDLGFQGEDYSSVQAWVESLGIPHQVIRSEFGPRAHSTENRENPCFLCSRLRRTALFEEAGRLGCTKIARPLRRVQRPGDWVALKSPSATISTTSLRLSSSIFSMAPR